MATAVDAAPRSMSMVMALLPRSSDDQRFARDMRRATVSDVAPTCEQMGLAVAAE